jgi:hypothetical protein
MILPHFNYAFARTVQARAWALLAAAAALAPEMAPRDLADWLAAQIPGVPSWASWFISAAIILFRLWRASKAIATASEAT